MGVTGCHIKRHRFRLLPRSGKSFFTPMSIHINNQFAKKRGIGKKLLLTIRAVMLKEHVDLVSRGLQRFLLGADHAATVKKTHRCGTR